MTTLKKPEKKEWNQVEGREGNIKTDTRNQTIDEMDAYYKPIVEELFESLEKCIEQFQDVHFCQDCGREEDKKVIDEAKQSLAKYKEIK